MASTSSPKLSADVVSAFMAWLLDRGVEVADSVAWPHQFPAANGGRGVAVRGDASVAAGAVVVTVPQAAMLTPDAARAHLAAVSADVDAVLSGESAPVDGGDVDVLALAAYVVYHSTLGVASPHAPWLAVLPTADDLAGMPLLWPPPAREWLGPQLARTVGASIARWQAAGAAVATALPAVAAVPAATWLWAVAVVTSRTFLDGFAVDSFDPSVVMVPFVDMFNHTAAASPCVEDWQPHGSLVVTAPAAAATAAHHQLCISYGDNSVEDMLLTYGFVGREGATMDDAVRVAVPAAPRTGDTDADAATRAHLLLVAALPLDVFSGLADAASYADYDHDTLAALGSVCVTLDVAASLRSVLRSFRVAVAPPGVLLRYRDDVQRMLVPCDDAAVEAGAVSALAAAVAAVVPCDDTDMGPPPEDATAAARYNAARMLRRVWRQVLAPFEAAVAAGSVS